MLKVGSLFSGIGGLDLGLEYAGMSVSYQVEIDKFCNKILDKYWPNVPKYPDVKEFTGKEHEVDIITGGFPCQDLSIAGKRVGLKGDRSGLWFEYKRILQTARPRWCIIENVPGLLNSDKGGDFSVVLRGLEECGFEGVGWRVFNSRFHVVPQQRRRVYLVGGPSRRSVAQVLSLCESCGRDLESCGKTKQETTTGDRVSVAKPLGAKRRHDLDQETYVVGVTVAPELQERDYKGSGGFFNGHVQAIIAFQDARDGPKNQNGVGWRDDGISYTIDGASKHAVADPNIQYRVRRLTPIECERLQGFPDRWTCICDQDICKCPDTNRYRALGNAVTVDVAHYVGRQIIKVEQDG